MNRQLLTCVGVHIEDGSANRSVAGIAVYSSREQHHAAISLGDDHIVVVRAEVARLNAFDLHEGGHIDGLLFAGGDLHQHVVHAAFIRVVRRKGGERHDSIRTLEHSAHDRNRGRLETLFDDGRLLHAVKRKAKLQGK